MVDKCKYIVIDHHLTGSAMIVFPNFMTHASVAFSLEGHGEPLSAGFVEMCHGEAYCVGESVSLKLKSRRGDSAILERMLNGERNV